MGSVPRVLEGERYDQFALESFVKSYWEGNNIYRKVKEKSSRASKKFYFLDGPPYASAKSIHIGTAWNKVVKDVVLRFYRMTGHNVWDKPGYDTHGLPIEVKIEQSLGVRVKREIEERVGVENFIAACKRFVDENMEAMTRQFKEIGVFMDWDNPYVTYRDDYIESGWWLVKKAWEKGLLYKGYRVLHWCPRCETTLADYEVSEYRELEDPSIYVKFPVEGREGEYLLVWTTTPWTLPANAFVMAHPEMEYVRVRVGGETLILAKPRLEHVMREAGVSGYEVLQVLKGSQLEGLRYRHPLEDVVDAQRELSKWHKVVMAPEAVTPHEGSGLVHSAPGHGTVDYEVAKRIGAPVVSLVDERGFMTEAAGKYRGLYFRGEANRAIVEDLRERGALFHEATIVHRYPVCWRCKTPLLLRATTQWFVAVTRLKDQLMREAEKVEWQPGWAKTRFMNMLKELRDWVISRQRYWGIPLPVWRCGSCGYEHVVGSVEELMSMGGEKPENLHRPWVDRVELKCPRCGGTMRRVPDVLDVWFDSGIAFYASLGYPKYRETWERLKPVDFIVEGHDQIRGWFFSLLRSGVIGFGEAPYRRVLVHGFALDEQGKEMHKSLGNYVDFEELISKVPRDVVRFWVLQNTVWEDLRFSWKGLDLMRRDFTVIWNVYAFASTYMGLDRFDPKSVGLGDIEDSLEVEDRWILSRLASLKRRYMEAMEDLRIHDAARALRSFIIEDVSHWYLRIIRRRVWEEVDTPSKRAAYATLYKVLWEWLLMAAPFIPYTAEYLYIKVFREAEERPEESIHMLDMPEPEDHLVDSALEEDMEKARMVIEAILSARNEAGLKLRRPVRRVIIAASSQEAERSLRRLEGLIRLMANAKEIEFAPASALEATRIYRVEPDYGRLGPRFKREMPKVLRLIEERGGEIGRLLAEKGVYEAEYEGLRIRLTLEDVSLKAEYPEWLKVRDTPLGLVAVDTRLTREEVLEGVARDIVRRIQAMRKEAGYNVEDYVEVWIEGSGDVEEAVNALKDYIKRETRAVRLELGTPPSGVEVLREWELDGDRVVIGLRRAAASG
ncbi:isoleucine--tRNA ligase [Aeropyrum camini]|uniref:Isoleucine--tRNA ligase n=2 Tax=Aeropyrum camini TaxID=229980 RepID=U3TBE9_9CREN|nr:isoleucine--tRNA ligase [Aeropyrum camini]BAN89746.1 isoleucyl-tRNA synthetase [Aeropyrum camini SY1 = JCM 12091]